MTVPLIIIEAGDANTPMEHIKYHVTMNLLKLFFCFKYNKLMPSIAMNNIMKNE